MSSLQSTGESEAETASILHMLSSRVLVELEEVDNPEDTQEIRRLAIRLVLLLAAMPGKACVKAATYVLAWVREASWKDCVDEVVKDFVSYPPLLASLR